MGADTGREDSNCQSTNLNRKGAADHADRQRGHPVVFDARVHALPSISKSNTDGADHAALITLQLRRTGGHFVNILLGPDTADSSSLDAARALTVESLVRVTGCFHPDADNANQANERRDGVSAPALPSKTTFRASKLVTLSIAKPGLENNPIHQLDLHRAQRTTAAPSSTASIDVRLDNRLLDARVSATAAIFKLFSGVHEQAVAILAEKRFIHIPTPALIGYEFPGEEEDLFSVPYFDIAARLAPTGEVHLGMALAADLERVYDFHTVFRREPLSDGRHLTEFTMLELVFNLKDDWTEILDLASDIVTSLIQSLQQEDKYNSLTQTAKRLFPLAGTFKLGLDKNGKLFQCTFSEAKEILQGPLNFTSSSDQADFTRDEEAALGRYFASSSSYFGIPTDVFIITHFPRRLRACNIHPSVSLPGTSESFDVILRGQEIATGCRLLHAHDHLRAAFAARDPPIDPDSPGWRPYTTAHEIGMPPWGGFGMGVNRLVQGFLGLEDVRETVLFPRDAARLRP
ncbi:class II aaRS and biotin synthetase [Coniochaeta ligniaria NRRL 30616]|uniref:Class II aaRS and biotin synthetase n=1 Tax=Coniochaeta ligniaria NRRL 30616 TaxID=1408157 RepID=A0A1J7JHI7_9PEZI|nr:class II aaRS and biotin synthetase [Coniochaeta ligniaria NRRL 30616]